MKTVRIILWVMASALTALWSCGPAIPLVPFDASPGDARGDVTSADAPSVDASLEPDAEPGVITYEPLVCANPVTTEGVDVSRWQGNIDWSAVARTSVRFAYIRVGDGVTVDPTFATNWRASRDAGLLRGCYVFFRPTLDAAAQARMVVEQCGPLDARTLPPAIDIEDTPGQQLPARDVLVAQIQTAVDVIAAGLGRSPLLYTSPGFWDSNVNSGAFADRPLWVAHWNATCPRVPVGWSTWITHQYTDRGTVSGISTAVDRDRFNGTVDDLERFAGGRTCAPGCSGATLTARDCATTNCAAMGLLCASDATGARCVHPRCPTSGVREVCLDGARLAGCENGMLTSTTACPAGGRCETSGGAGRCVGPASIVVSSPTGGVFVADDTVNAVWSSMNLPDGQLLRIVIRVVGETAETASANNSAPLSGMQGIRLPRSWSPGRYEVCVTTPDGASVSATGCSAPFELRAGCTPAPEACNGRDDDCDGMVDEGVTSAYFPDLDGDGYGARAGAQQACAAPTGFVARGGDCDDGRRDVNPAATEACNGRDDDCNGTVDEGDGGCRTPPASSCSGNVASVWSPAGTCVAGTCQYAEVQSRCAAGCAGTTCATDRCLGVTCSTPPADRCADGATLERAAARGTCDPATGRCAYALTTERCPFGCAGALCVDPCASVTCGPVPAPSCVDTQTLRTSRGPGACDPALRACAFPTVDERCPNGCRAGACAAAERELFTADRNPGFERTDDPFLAPPYTGWVYWENRTGLGGCERQTAPDAPEGSAFARCTIRDVVGAPWEALLNQVGLLIVPGRTYSLSFYARANATRLLQVSVQMHHGGDSYGLSDTRVVGTEWQRFSFTFVARTTTGLPDSDSKLAAWLLNGPGTIDFDAFSLVER